MHYDLLSTRRARRLMSSPRWSLLAGASDSGCAGAGPVLQVSSLALRLAVYRDLPPAHDVRDVSWARREVLQLSKLELSKLASRAPDAPEQALSSKSAGQPWRPLPLVFHDLLCPPSLQQVPTACGP